MRLVIFILALLTAVPTTDAAKRGGVTLPDTITVANKKLTLNGMGVREATWLKVDVYVAGLYVEHVSSNAATLVTADEPKVLVLRFVRDVDRADIIKAWNQGFKDNATVPMSRIKPYIDDLNQWMPEFNEGDTLTFTYVPTVGVSVDINKVRKGVIKDPDFARSLFSIWLGAKPPTGDLKRGLLGKH